MSLCQIRSAGLVNQLASDGTIQPTVAAALYVKKVNKIVRHGSLFNDIADATPIYYGQQHRVQMKKNTISKTLKELASTGQLLLALPEDLRAGLLEVAQSAETREVLLARIGRDTTVPRNPDDAAAKREFAALARTWGVPAAPVAIGLGYGYGDDGAGQAAPVDEDENEDEDWGLGQTAPEDDDDDDDDDEDEGLTPFTARSGYEYEDGLRQAATADEPRVTTGIPGEFRTSPSASVGSFRSGSDSDSDSDSDSVSDYSDRAWHDARRVVQLQYQQRQRAARGAMHAPLVSTPSVGGARVPPSLPSSSSSRALSSSSSSSSSSSAFARHAQRSAPVPGAAMVGFHGAPVGSIYGLYGAETAAAGRGESRALTPSRELSPSMDASSTVSGSPLATMALPSPIDRQDSVTPSAAMEGDEDGEHESEESNAAEIADLISASAQASHLEDSEVPSERSAQPRASAASGAGTGAGAGAFTATHASPRIGQKRGRESVSGAITAVSTPAAQVHAEEQDGRITTGAAEAWGGGAEHAGEEVRSAFADSGRASVRRRIQIGLKICVPRLS